jgi:hypothetical protein
MIASKKIYLNLIVVLSILFSAIAPSLGQMLSDNQKHEFSMEVCSVSGTHSSVDIGTPISDQDHKAETQPCLYCTLQNAMIAVFNTDLVFAIQSPFAFFPKIFYQSPKPLTVWVTPPSAAPPVQA